MSEQDTTCIECGETHNPCRCGNPTKCDPTDGYEPFVMCDICDAMESDSRLDPLRSAVQSAQKMREACQALVTAYGNGKDAGSVEWSELDHACELARLALADGRKDGAR